MAEQYKVQLEMDVIKRLDDLALKFGRRSGNTIAAEVLREYMDFWEYAEQAKQAVVSQQRSMLVDPMRVPVIGNSKGTKGGKKK